MNILARAVLAGTFAASMLAAPVAFAEDSGTAKGGTPSANSGSSSDKTDQKTQENENSADKDKQKR